MTDRSQDNRSRRYAALIAAMLLPLSSVSHAQAAGAAGAAAPGTAGTAATGTTGAAAAPVAGTTGNNAAPAMGTTGTAATAPSTATTPASAGASATAPAANVAAPAGATSPAPPPANGSTGPLTGTLTLDQVVARVLSNNTSVQLAQERLKKAGYQIDEAYAGARPQINLSVTDTQTSYKTFNAGAGSVSSGVSLGTIPVITDTGGSTSTTVVAGGGGTTSTGETTTGTGTGTTTGTQGTSGASSSTTGGTTGTGTTGTGTAAPQFHSQSVTPTSNQTASIGHGTAITTPQGVSTVSHRLESHGLVQPNASTNNGNNNSSSGYYNNAGAVVSVTQPVDIFGYIPAGIDVERRTRDFYKIDLDRTQNEIALSTKTAFFTLLKDEANVAVYQEQVTADTENVRIAQAKFTAGTAARYDVLTAQTTLANDQQSLSSAQDQVNLAVANLNSALGQPLDTPLNVVAPALPPLDQPIDLNAAVQRAYKDRPELRQADNNIEIARKLVKLAGASLSPSLGISGNADYSQHVSTGDHDTWSLSATLAIPLYDGGTTHAKVKEAQSDLTTQEITRTQLRQSVELECRQAYLNANDARARATAASASVDSAEEAYRLAQVRYQNGLNTFVEVTTSAAQLTTARTNLASAQFDFQTSLAQLLRAEGGR